jgi:haloalkane dehalogenase
VALSSHAHASTAPDSGVQWVRLGARDSVRVEVQGVGPPIVLLAGPMGGTWSFRHVTAGLVAAGYRVVVGNPFDAEHAGSLRDLSLTAVADRWAAVLDTLHVEHGTLVAHSLSNSIALRLAGRRPELVSALVSLEGGMTERIATPGLRRATAMAPFVRLFGAAGMIRNRIASSLRERSASSGWVTGEVIDAYARPIASDMPRALRLLRQLSETHEPESVEARAGTIRAPVLLLLGAVAQASRPSHAEIVRMQVAMPSMAIDTVANAGHFLHEEQPAAVIARILEVAAANQP